MASYFAAIECHGLQPVSVKKSLKTWSRPQINELSVSAKSSLAKIGSCQLWKLGQRQRVCLNSWLYANRNTHFVAVSQPAQYLSIVRVTAALIAVSWMHWPKKNHHYLFKWQLEYRAHKYCRKMKKTMLITLIFFNSLRIISCNLFEFARIVCTAYNRMAAQRTWSPRIADELRNWKPQCFFSLDSKVSSVSAHLGLNVNGDWFWDALQMVLSRVLNTYEPHLYADRVLLRWWWWYTPCANGISGRCPSAKHIPSERRHLGRRTHQKKSIKHHFNLFLFCIHFFLFFTLFSMSYGCGRLAKFTLPSKPPSFQAGGVWGILEFFTASAKLPIDSRWLSHSKLTNIHMQAEIIIKITY